MTFLQLQQRTAGWLSRDVTDFTQNSFNNLQQSINDAQRLAQRLVDFDFAVQRGYLPLTSGTGNYITAMVDAPGGSSVSVQKLKAVYTNDEYTLDLPIRRLEDQVRYGPTEGGQYVYTEGQNLYLKNDDTTGGLYVKYYQKLADLSADGDTNFLTDYCGDWLALQAAFEMLHYIKEDERVQLSAGLLRYKWDSVVTWNESFTSEQDLTLD
jgi:hypothetical protein